jgi:tripartite-type tricarboxylate transporter receptor subunit TctC
MQSWYGMLVPSGVAEDRIARLYAAFAQVVRSEELKARLEAGGFTTVWDESPAAFGAYIRSQDAVWRELVELSGATLD